jgi:putative transposase
VTKPKRRTRPWLAYPVRGSIVGRSADLEAEDLPEQVAIELRELVGAAKEGLLALSVGVGLAVVHELFEAEVSRLAGPKGKHDPDRRAYRYGRENRQVTLGGRRAQVSKPRVRSVEDEEMELRTYRDFAKRDLLNQAALGRMLAGLSTRQYPVGLEPMGQVEALGTSKSAISPRFIERKLGELFGRDLSQLNLVAMFIDGVEIAEHCIVVAPASLLEGLEETLTVTRLGLSGSLLDTFKSTNPIESMISIARIVTRNVKRWRSGKMALRWTAAGLLDAEERFRRVKGYRELVMLRRALHKHHDGLASTRKSA